MAERILRQPLLHLAPLARLFPHGLEIDTIGYIPKKKNRIHTVFNTFNFSFILRGAGDYRYENNVYPVEAPCVLTQIPGIPMDYGPKETWEELFFIYPLSAGPILTKRNYMNRKNPFWQIGSSETFFACVDDFFASVQTLESRVQADVIDGSCEQLIRTSLLEASRLDAGTACPYLLDIEHYIDTHLHEQIIWEELCDRYAVHPAAFRRAWKSFSGIPPGKYLSEKRLAQAKRYLVESSFSAREIAFRCGYSDELYFYRLFRKKVGMTALEYRKRFKNFFIS
jgi:AraC-like DNA-binding protein